MTFEEMTRGLAEFVRDHQAWAAPVVFALAFAESLAFLSLVVPAWGALVAIVRLLPWATERHGVDRAIGIVVLLTTSWPRIERQLPRVVAAIGESSSGRYVEVHID